MSRHYSFMSGFVSSPIRHSCPACRFGGSMHSPRKQSVSTVQPATYFSLVSMKKIIGCGWLYVSFLRGFSWQDLPEFEFNILCSFNMYRIWNGTLYCIFILCLSLLLWIRNNPSNPHHPQWCLVVNFPIF